MTLADKKTTMTKNERLILINQYEILMTLKPDEAESYRERITILSEGYEIFYDTLTEWIDDDMDESKSRFVLDILDLYLEIHSFILINESEVVSNHPRSYFHGFDGNNEGEYLSFARFLIEEQGKYQEQIEYFEKNDSMNSHMTKVGTYEVMLEAQKRIGKTYSLGEDEILQILDAPNG